MPRKRIRPADNLEFSFRPSVPGFVNKWTSCMLSERAAAQSHFIELCHLLGQPTPTELDVEGTDYTFEKGATKTSGGNGFADVWKRGYFAWEYKRKHKNLHKAYMQLLQYREDLENPPLLVVSDLENFEIHTNFPNTRKQIYKFSLSEMLSNHATPKCIIPPLDVLRFIFVNPEKLNPGQSTSEVTEEAAAEFAKLAESLRNRKVPSERAAHFLTRLLFCLFAQDVGLLPEGLFTRLVESNRHKPVEFKRKLKQLFGAMACDGGSFGADNISYFDGGLFLDDEAYDLTTNDLNILLRAAKLSWASIEPAVFGTLFERGLDPNKREQLGAHFTSREDIECIVEPVLMAPLRERWAVVRNDVVSLVASGSKKNENKAKINKKISNLLRSFLVELSSIKILDPACGSGNFLYVAMKRLLDLEKEVSMFAMNNGLSGFFIQCHPKQLYGIESNSYAHALASVAAWIGYLQWQRDNGIIINSHPILRPLENIRCMDAILCYTKSGPCGPEWPSADVIIGNPPFLGGNKLRKQLGDKYVDDLFKAYSDQVPAFADLVCYWFEKARCCVQKNSAMRVGLLATNSIRGGVNRKVLEKIKDTGEIFWAQSDRAWVLDGASVRVSMIGFDKGKQPTRILDGVSVKHINADLSASTDTTGAIRLKENEDLCFMGPSAKGPFDIPELEAQKMLKAPTNVNGRRNIDVVRPVKSGFDLVREDRKEWTIDFELRDKKSAAQYEAPFEYVLKHVYPIRSKNRRKAYADKWWLYAEPRPGMRKALSGLSRYVATPAVSKHRILVWVSSDVLCNQGTLVFAREDDYFFGVLQSRIHDVWALKQGTSLEDRPRYTPTTTFETFPFPWPPTEEPRHHSLKEKIATAARELVKKRDAWLHPRGAVKRDLQEGTLTELYNEYPTWLLDAHRELDRAVLSAYGWRQDSSDDEVLARLLQLNQERAVMKRKTKKPVASVGRPTSTKMLPVIRRKST